VYYSLKCSGQENLFCRGCFWGTEKYFPLILGVLRTSVSYANGNSAYPSYDEVRSQQTGHAETVALEYETDIIRFIPVEKLEEEGYGEYAGLFLKEKHGEQ